MQERNIFPAWSLSVEETLKTLEASTRGLSPEDAKLRLKHFGSNTLPTQARFTFVSLVLRQFASPLIFILFAAAVLSFFLKEWVEMWVIIIAITTNAGLGFYQEFRAENALEKLTTYIRDRARVLRGGTEEEIDSMLLVPGDLIRLNYGSRVPADARIIEENGLAIDEAVLTGESLPVRKNIETLTEGVDVADRDNMVHAGTMVVEGHASALVTATGSATEIGRIAELVSTTRDTRTPLQRALSCMAWLMFIGISVLVIGIFFLGLSRGVSIFDMLLMAAAISVGAVPESLPIALTVILAVGVERLAKRKGIIRNLAAAETLGSATIVMTDKTGTLTQANLQLVDVVTRKELIHNAHIGGYIEDEEEVLASALWGSDVTIENPHEPKKEWRFLGRPFDVGMYRAAHERSIDVAPYLENHAAPLLVFNSTNKFAIVAGGNERFVVGAPDILIKRSKFTKDEYLLTEERLHAIANEGKRVVGVARLKVHRGESVMHADDAKNLDFLGMLIFQDPIRLDASQAVQTIQDLGARVVMVTGDLKGTAMAVARELGWKVESGHVLSGEELRALSDAELRTVLPRMQIFARVTPQDKLRIGTLYRELGEVVAMTGDGVNDAPSLKAVDIGVALGSGSDVAKSVADLVILDDNFKTIVAAIEEGRRILENIRKVFVYLVSTSLSEVFLIGGSLAFGLPFPLTALQIIWINFFSDSLPALSFAFDKHSAEKNTRASSHSIFNFEVTILTGVIGIMTSLMLFMLYYLLLKIGIDVEHARSTLFLCFSLSVLAIAFPLRNLRAPLYSYNPFSNRALTLSVIIGSLFTIATVSVPFLKNIFELVTPPSELWWTVALWLVVNVCIVEIAKWIARRMHIL